MLHICSYLLLHMVIIFIHCDKKCICWSNFHTSYLSFASYISSLFLSFDFSISHFSCYLSICIHLSPSFLRSLTSIWSISLTHTFILSLHFSSSLTSIFVYISLLPSFILSLHFSSSHLSVCLSIYLPLSHLSVPLFLPLSVFSISFHLYFYLPPSLPLSSSLSPPPGVLEEQDHA